MVEAHLVGGSQLRLGDFELTADADSSGDILKTVRARSDGARGYFEVRESVRPQGSGLPRTLIVHHPDATQHAYNIVRIEPHGDGSRLFTREDPAFEITGKGRTRFLSYPQRETEGSKHTYELLTAVHVKWQDGR